MALKPCQGCGREVDQTAKACPGCGRPNPTGSGKVVKLMAGFGMLTILGVSGIVCVAFCSGAGKSVSTDRRGNGFQAHIERQVADDAVAQYKIAKDTGSDMDACVHAGLVKAAFVQAKDEDNAAQWRVTELLDCRRAGVPGN